MRTVDSTAVVPNRVIGNSAMRVESGAAGWVSPLPPSEELRAAAEFYARNYVRRAVIEAGVGIDAALVAVSFLAAYYQTEDGQLYIPEGRLAAGVYEVIR